MVRTATQALLVLTDRLSALDMVLSCGAPSPMTAQLTLRDVVSASVVSPQVCQTPHYDVQVPC